MSNQTLKQVAMKSTPTEQATPHDHKSSGCQASVHKTGRDPLLDVSLGDRLDRKDVIFSAGLILLTSGHSHLAFHFREEINTRLDPAHTGSVL